MCGFLGEENIYEPPYEPSKEKSEEASISDVISNMILVLIISIGAWKIFGLNSWSLILIFICGLIFVCSIYYGLKIKRYQEQDNYLFIWDNIPGNDNESLIEFLTQKFGIDWVKTAKVEKICDGRTIRLTDENNFLLLKLNNEKTKVNLEINGDIACEIIAKIENGKLSIYKDKSRSKLDESLEILSKNAFGLMLTSLFMIFVLLIALSISH